jgi:hypothetical protein
MKENEMFKKTLFTAVSLLIVSTAAQAEGISIEPGKWEMNTVMTMPMLPEPKVTTVTECMEKDEITPESMSEDMNNPDADCKMNAEVVGDDTMKWTMDCSEEMGNSRGEWEVTSYGDSMKGGGSVTMNVQGQEIVMTMEWEGKRIGACD